MDKSFRPKQSFQEQKTFRWILQIFSRLPKLNNIEVICSPDISKEYNDLNKIIYQGRGKSIAYKLISESDCTQTSF